MGQYLLIPFLVGWTSIYQLFWGSLGTRVLTHPHLKNMFWTITHPILEMCSCTKVPSNQKPGDGYQLGTRTFAITPMIHHLWLIFAQNQVFFSWMYGPDALVSHDIPFTSQVVSSHWDTLWLFDIAMENGPFIDGLPIKNGWIFPWQTVSHNQMVVNRGYED